MVGKDYKKITYFKTDKWYHSFAEFESIKSIYLYTRLD